VSIALGILQTRKGRGFKSRRRHMQLTIPFWQPHLFAATTVLQARLFESASFLPAALLAGPFFCNHTFFTATPLFRLINLLVTTPGNQTFWLMIHPLATTPFHSCTFWQLCTCVVADPLPFMQA
jgi:hypothetical protein